MSMPAQSIWGFYASTICTLCKCISYWTIQSF